MSHHGELFSPAPAGDRKASDGEALDTASAAAKAVASAAVAAASASAKAAAETKESRSADERIAAARTLQPPGDDLDSWFHGQGDVMHESPDLVPAQVSPPLFEFMPAIPNGGGADQKASLGRPVATAIASPVSSGSLASSSAQATTSPSSRPRNAHATDGDGISVDEIQAMLDKNASEARSAVAQQTSSHSAGASKEEFRVTGVRHRRMSDGLFGFTPSLAAGERALNKATKTAGSASDAQATGTTTTTSRNA